MEKDGQLHRLQERQAYRAQGVDVKRHQNALGSASEASSFITRQPRFRGDPARAKAAAMTAARELPKCEPRARAINQTRTVERVRAALLRSANRLADGANASLRRLSRAPRSSTRHPPLPVTTGARGPFAITGNGLATLLVTSCGVSPDRFGELRLPKLDTA
ncbi:hypothetical protein HPB48_020750 [Haemaphysalis longicornis]|uniref:Uncharacterized protein n=1 Tax=Haemaphysalis longicornis TaxID=44386 RepID=A0A9J6H3Z5_HAELO|nr:hypothetical protein HPB48_020750 [Haemaphysalis longicornis]